MNFSGITTKSLRTSIDELLGGVFPTQIKRIYAASVDKPNCGCAKGRQVWPTVASHMSVSGWHDYLRWKVATTLRAALAHDEMNEQGRLSSLKAARLANASMSVRGENMQAALKRTDIWNASQVTPLTSSVISSIPVRIGLMRRAPQKNGNCAVGA